MEYVKYKTIYNYMMSDWARKYPLFGNVKVLLTNTNDASKFDPSNKCFISNAEFTDYFLNDVKGIKNVTQNKFVMNDNKLKNTSVTTDSDTTGESVSTGCYEEVFNTPAFNNGQKCPFIQSYKGKARREAEANGESELSDYQALKRAFSWKTDYDADEYNKLSIPVTPLNQDTVCFNADATTVSARQKFIAKGALIANSIGDNLFPIYFIDFEKANYYNQYIFDWNPNGIFRVK